MNLKNYLSLVILGALVAAFTGCTSAPKVESEYDPSEDFTVHTTFFVVPFPTEIPNVDPGTLMRITGPARAATESTMLAKGYTEVNTIEEADIVVLVHGKSVPKTEVYNSYTPVYGGAWGYGRYPYSSYNMNSVSVDNYDEGTLIVEMHEVETEQMIWVGWMTARAKNDTSGQAERVTEAVAQILAKYPDQGVDAGLWATIGTE